MGEVAEAVSIVGGIGKRGTETLSDCGGSAGTSERRETDESVRTVKFFQGVVADLSCVLLETVQLALRASHIVSIESTAGHAERSDLRVLRVLQGQGDWVG